MKILFSRRLTLLSACAAALAVALPAAGQTAWPARPIRLIVPAAPGAQIDMLARTFGEKLSASLKQPFVIDNKTGANGLIGTEAAARASPDGYTLLLTYTAAMVVNPFVYKNLPYDPVKDFEPVALTTSVSTLLVVTSDLPVRDLKDLVDYAKQRPSAVSYGTWGIGSGGHLTMESLLSRAGFQMVHVPYRSIGAVVTDMLGGSLKVGWTDVSSQIQHVQSGKLRVIAVNGIDRLPQLPDVATMAEQGFAFDATSWYGVFAPAGTPKEIVNRLNQELARILATPEIKAKFLSLNISLPPKLSPEQFASRVADDLNTWGGIVKAAGIQPE